ncbi:intermembrane transport protein PqiB [Aestuariirhabdus litorea]|uniref:MCE family protein n=1 Tax=Aestuariirhabdus litorea TaxID=2528527 RepID=A0A3P3VLX7_9GAMM|nr:intermembrane transport protein PqiB [Aestuariirhabdus litorea]RRJ83434.1 MCE family protein [Aestuariirhabdus litorea]RWW93596.1 intermembrane transport protein PqiB [Endozoicomonadaceae bacterium GTF-13]
MKPEVTKKKGFSKVWIVPILAAVLGVWMVIFSYLNQGPEVQVSFSDAADLVAGKTKVKLLNVDIGQVESVVLNENISGVVVGLRLEKQYESLLREDTQFWVERVRIGAGGISGLSTILSGAYIKLSPGTGKAGGERYVGLENPPQTKAGAPGIRLVLQADRVSSVDTGDPVLYHGYKVGRVESMRLEEGTGKIRYDIFIDAPYHKFINSAVRFWNASGISLNASAAGFSVNASSLDTILAGGVAFGAIPGLTPGEPVEENHEFTLFGSYQDSLQRTYNSGLYFVVRFNQDIGGLVPGAPVNYRGVNAGKVVRVMLKELADEEDTRYGRAIPVLLYLEPGRMDLPDTEEAAYALAEDIKAGVEKGLRASLKAGNLITGSQFVALDFYPTAEADVVGRFLDYPVIPTVPGGFDRIMVSVSSFLDTLNNLPLESTVSSANGTIDQLNQSLASMDHILKQRETRALPKHLSETLTALRETLDGLSPDSPVYQELGKTLLSLRSVLEGLSPRSPLYKELESSLFELNKTLKNMDELSASLKDTATMLPKPKERDLIPEARAQ